MLLSRLMTGWRMLRQVGRHIDVIFACLELAADQVISLVRVAQLATSIVSFS